MVKGMIFSGDTSLRTNDKLVETGQGDSFGDESGTVITAPFEVESFLNDYSYRGHWLLVLPYPGKIWELLTGSTI
jgi:hypothetical protein